MDIKLNYEIMEQICLADEPQFQAITGAEVKHTRHGALIYIDNNSDILAIAHLDSVSKAKHFYQVEVANKPYVLNAQLDDRLGAYIILSLLPALGLKFDVLLTTGEETGKSTAQFFETTKDYKWMFQFDRRGEDVALYQYDSPFLTARLKKAGFTNLQRGAFTDICYLSFLKCSGFNVSCGYEDEHSDWAKANMDIVKRQVSKFLVFYAKYKNLKFEYEEKPIVPKAWGRTSGVSTAPSTITHTNRYAYRGDIGDWISDADTDYIKVHIVKGIRYKYDTRTGTYTKLVNRTEWITDIQMPDGTLTLLRCKACDLALDANFGDDLDKQLCNIHKLQKFTSKICSCGAAMYNWEAEYAKCFNCRNRPASA